MSIEGEGEKIYAHTYVHPCIHEAEEMKKK